jgi:hypothetical protein
VLRGVKLRGDVEWLGMSNLFSEAVMPVVTAPDYLAVIKHLPPGGFLRADNVSWEVYDRLLSTHSVRQRQCAFFMIKEGWKPRHL